MSKNAKPVSLAPVKSLGKLPVDTPASLAAPDIKKVEAPVAVVAKPVAKPAVETVAKSIDKPVLKPGPAPATAKVAVKVVPETVVTPAKVALAAAPAAAKTSAQAPASAPASSMSSPARLAAVKTGKVKPGKSSKSPSAIRTAASAKPVVPETVAIAPVVSPAVVPAKKTAKPSPVASVKAVEQMPPIFALPGFTDADLSLPLPGADMWGGMAGRMLGAARAIGEFQATLLDHGVAQLKAGMSELEECARAKTPSEVVVIQARAIRRSTEDLTSTIKAASSKVGTVFTKG